MILLLSACGEPEPKTVPRETETDGEETTLPAETSDTGTQDTGTFDPGPQSVLQFDGDPPHNLIIVSLDTTRRDYIGRFTGNGNTPNLDRILSEGVALDDHRSCSSWTVPSMTCVTTGRSPFELGWWPWTYDGEVPGFDDDLPTIAGQLQFQKGYNTALVTANSLFDSGFNFDRGFQAVWRPSWEPAAAVTDDALEAASEILALGSPFYLHVHYIDPHGNYCPPDEHVDQEDYVDLGEDLCYDMYYLAQGRYWYEEQDWRDTFKTDLTELYDAEIEYWDTEFGLLWQQLDAMGALDDTLVVFVTDHGEQILERGALGHGNGLGAEENRSTAGFWAKNIVPQAWPGHTVHQDIAATLQDFFALTPPEPSTGTVVGLAPEGRDLRGLLYWAPGLARLSIVRGSLQLTYDWWGEAHFYDHSLDPSGLIDYYDPTDPDVISLQSPMQSFIDDIRAQWPSAGEPVPAW